jgi:alpha,alpha-trehalose phosphorylase
MAVVYGFGRYRWRTTEFAPILPTRARRLRFCLRLRGSVLEVDIEERAVTYSIKHGPPLTVRHYGTDVTVAPGAPRSFPGNYRTHDRAVTARSPH